MQERGRIASGGEKRLTMRFAASFFLSCLTLKETLADDKVSEGEATRIKKMLEDMPDKE